VQLFFLSYRYAGEGRGEHGSSWLWCGEGEEVLCRLELGSDWLFSASR
jgi:hypothetical protein